MTNSSELINNYNNLFSGLNLTTKALVAANLADETLKQYGLAKGLDSNASSSLLNMSMDMIMKMNSLPTKNVTAHNSGISAEPMSRIPANNQSSRNVLNPTDKSITNQANFESSASLAKSLKMLFLTIWKMLFLRIQLD